MEFVNFEIAKKLKEKGFPQSPDHFNYNNYYEWDGLRKIHPLYNINIWYDNINKKNLYFAPTISQVLKWLREEKKIHLYIDIDDKGWFFEIKYLKTYKVLNSNLIGRYFSYVEAALAGIEYVLDNLI